MSATVFIVTTPSVSATQMRALLNRRFATGSPSGFSLALSNAGIEYAREIGIPILEREMLAADVPGFSESVKTPVGHVKFGLNSISITNVDLAQSSIGSTTEGVGLTIQDGSLTIAASWHYRQKSFPHVKDSGKITLSASSISVDTMVTPGLAKSDSGHAGLELESCSSNIGSLKVKFHGGASWIYNAFKDLVASKIKSGLKPVVCSAFGSVIILANNALCTMPTTEKLDRWAGIDFGLSAAPETTASFLR